MIKFLLGFVFLAVSSLAHASGITVITASSRNSPVTTMATIIRDNLPNSRFIQADSCVDGINKFNSIPNSILTFGPNNVFAGAAKNQPCRPTIDHKNTVFYAEQFFKICTKKGSGKTLHTSNVTFGIPSVMLPTPVVNDINAQNGTSIKALPFSGSNDILLQIISGDLDLGLIGKSAAQKQESAGAIECVASTNPIDSNFVGKQLKMKIPDLRIPVVVLKNNIERSTDLEKVARALESEGFVNFLNQGDFVSRTTVGDQTVVEKINRYVERYIKNHVIDATK